MTESRTINAVRPQKKRATLIGLLAAFTVAYSIMPIVGELVRDYLSTYAYMALLLLLTVLIMLKEGSSSLFEYVFFMLPLIILEAESYFINTDSVLLWGYSVLLFLFPMILGYYVTKKKPEIMNILRIVVLLAVGITLLTTCIGLASNPFASRTLATTASSDDPLLRKYNYLNLGGFEFVYTVVLLYPLLILAFKQKKIGLLPTLFGVVGAFALALMSEYTTAFLFLLVSSLFFFFRRTIKVKTVLWLGILGVALFFVFRPFLSLFFAWLSRTVDSKEMAQRFLELSEGYGALVNSDNKRMFLYGRSLRSFLDYPLFGSAVARSPLSGGHSSTLDILANYGLFGFSFLLLGYRSIYRKFFRPYQGTSGFAYIFWVFFQAFILSILNPGMWLAMLCLYAPVFFPVLCEPNEKSPDEIRRAKRAERVRLAQGLPMSKKPSTPPTSDT